jgi:hypothetical protein
VLRFPMGDTPQQPGAPAEYAPQDTGEGALQASFSTAGLGEVMIEGQPPFPAAYLHHQPGSPQHAVSSQLNMTQQHGMARGQPFDMNAMAAALPQAQGPAGYRPGPYGQGQQARYNAIAMSAPVSPYGTQAATAPVPGQQYYLAQQHGHMAHFYPTPMPPQPGPANLSPRADLAYYQNAMMVNQQPHAAAQYYYPQTAHYSGQGPAQPMMAPYAAPSPQQQMDSRQLHPTTPQTGSQAGGVSSPADPGLPEGEGRPSVVRGPPRKPRQSGHAIWIGNLPPQTDLMSLVHHVCKEAEGLESLFLISKSNCAFANFKDEPASIAAQRKLHDSKFQTVRLVSRLRKSTVEGPAGVTAPTGPAASAAQADPPGETTTNAVEAVAEEEGAKLPSAAAASGQETESANAPVVNGSPALKDRFFILKSLTIEDIELSARTGIWATQAHNEETLNKAFKSADNVYLIFSANKSGEYFGYARMVSPIIDDPDAAIEFAPKAQPASDVDLPRAIPTEATEFAPKGRIIDDSARGTIFWEAERDDHDDDGSGGGSVSGGDTGSVKSGQDGAGGGGEPKAWGKPFRLEWLSTARLPFYRTRGLRNPWNSNREVKIARDGTELEPSVGRRLIGLFNRAQSPALGVHVIPSLVPAVVSGIPYVPAQHLYTQH